MEKEDLLRDELFLKNEQYVLLTKRQWDKLLKILNNHKEVIEYIDSRLIDLREEFEKQLKGYPFCDCEEED